jgi:hypothetical protein
MHSILIKWIIQEWDASIVIKWMQKTSKIVRFIYGERRNSFEVSERLQKPTRYANHHQSNSIMLIEVDLYGETNR